jgi:hypothetical protein
MPKRSDDTYINVYYGGHPPNCTCSECSKLRVRIACGKPLNDNELAWAANLREWVPTNRECQYCHEPKQMWRKKDNKIGCDNMHCRKYYEYL